MKKITEIFFLLNISGTVCEIDIDECENHNCQNGATCINGEGTYYCECQSGWEGPLCQFVSTFASIHSLICCKIQFQVTLSKLFCRFHLQDKNECLFSPCFNNAPCTDLVNDFRCECPPQFTGRYHSCQRRKL